MGFRRILICAVAAAIALAACSSGDDGGDAAISVEEPIGAPEPADTYAPAADPSVVKNAAVEMKVARRDLSDAAQAVVDVATSPKAGGFLVSSVVDLEDGYGSGLIVVEVPAARFEETVVELGTIGELTRQEMSGQDLTEEAVAARRQVRQSRNLVRRLGERLDDATGDAADALRLELKQARDGLDSAARERAYYRSETTYAPIEVALYAKAPPPAPEKPVLEQALETAKAITLGIAAGAVIAAGVVVPVGLVVLALYLVWTAVLHRLRVRWES